MSVSQTLTVTELIEAACEETGLDDFGDASFMKPLESYIASVSTEAHLGPLGHEVLRMDTLRLLTNRQRLQADLNAHPEILDEDVSDPIVIAGLPRTGTTKLHRAIAADPKIQSLPFWLAMNPGRIPVEGDEPDPRIAMGEAQSDALTQLGPEFMAAHPMSTHEPEEDVLLLQMTFDRAAAFTWYYDAPSHYEAMEGRSQHGPYRFLRETLQNLQWQDGGRRGRTWVLKSPVHLGNLAALLAAFPNATVVHCHRRLDVVMPSFCRLLETIRPARGVSEVDNAQLGRFYTALHADGWERNLAERTDAPEPGRLLDVAFDDIVSELVPIIHSVYGAHGLDLTDAAENAFRDWEQANPPHARGRHVYDMETYELTPKMLEEAFSVYIERFPEQAPGA